MRKPVLSISFRLDSKQPEHLEALYFDVDTRERFYYLGNENHIQKAGFLMTWLLIILNIFFSLPCLFNC